MGIGRISGLYQSYPIEPIKRVDLETVREQDEIKKQQANEIPVANPMESPALENKASKTADLENISLGFNKSDTYDYIGSEKDLSLLDMEKVLSDMKKDSVLDQYRYFVGTKESEDGIVIMK